MGTGVSVASGVVVGSGVDVGSSVAVGGTGVSVGDAVGAVVDVAVGVGVVVGVDPHAVTTIPVIASPATRKNVLRSIFRCWLFVFVVWLLGVVGMVLLQ